MFEKYQRNRKRILKKYEEILEENKLSKHLRGHFMRLSGKFEVT